jgi:hypothetical protein
VTITQVFYHQEFGNSVLVSVLLRKSMGHSVPWCGSQSASGGGGGGGAALGQSQEVFYFASLGGIAVGACFVHGRSLFCKVEVWSLNKFEIKKWSSENTKGYLRWCIRKDHLVQGKIRADDT